MNTFQLATTGLTLFITMMVTSEAISQTTDDSATSTPVRYGTWTSIEDNKQGSNLQVMRLKVYPKPAPVPALSYRLIPDPAERTDGNSAPAYLKAMGFVEQTNARIALSKLERKWYDEATIEQQSNYDYPPGNWREMPPEELPLEEVEEYLHLISFQEPMLYDAARRKNYSQDRAMERESNPIGYLLPEVQQMRGLARHQILRLRYAVAQNRIDDAVEILGQMLAMANHIGQDEFMVSSLVGVAIQGMTAEEGLALSQQEELPNLYWALAACPRPLIGISRVLESERLIFERQFPILQEVDEKVRPKEYWADFVKRLLPQLNTYISTVYQWNQSTGLPEKLDAFQFATLIAAQYEPARRFLGEACGMSDEQLDNYTATQVIFLAMVKYHDILQDETTTLFYLPYPDRNRVARTPVRKRWSSELGWIAKFLRTITLPNSEQILQAIARGDQQIALWQTLEALRMTTAANEGEAPGSLDDFIVPAPLDPASGKPFRYRVDGNTVTITGAKFGNRQYQLLIELVQQSKENK